MASTAMLESQAGQSAVICSPRTLLTKLGPRPIHDERERLPRSAGRYTGNAACCTFLAVSTAAEAGG